MLQNHRPRPTGYPGEHSNDCICGINEWPCPAMNTPSRPMNGIVEMDWEQIEYALIDRTISITPREPSRWIAKIKINDITFESIGLTPGLAVDHLCEQIVWHKERYPYFIIARHDISNITPDPNPNPNPKVNA